MSTKQLRMVRVPTPETSFIINNYRPWQSGKTLKRSLDVLRAAVTFSRALWPFEHKRGIHYCTENWEVSLVIDETSTHKHWSFTKFQFDAVLRYQYTLALSHTHTQKSNNTKTESEVTTEPFFSKLNSIQNRLVPLLPPHHHHQKFHPYFTGPCYVTNVSLVIFFERCSQPYVWSPLKMWFLYVCDPFFHIFTRKVATMITLSLFFCNHFRLLQSHVLIQRRYLDVGSWKGENYTKRSAVIHRFLLTWPEWLDRKKIN